MFHLLRILTLTITSFFTLTSATGCYGPNTCLQGWVWRQAIPTDYVCVTPAVRTQTAQDNAAAASRVNPQGGPYGPATCLNGYVWREAYPNDQVCVPSATRTQAAADNAAAGSRVLTMMVWSQAQADSEKHLQIWGEGFNFGGVKAALFDSAGNTLVNWVPLQAISISPYPAGAWIWETAYIDCAPSTRGTVPSDGYVVALDEVSGCYTSRIPVNYCQ